MWHALSGKAGAAVVLVSQHSQCPRDQLVLKKMTNFCNKDKPYQHIFTLIDILEKLDLLLLIQLKFFHPIVRNWFFFQVSLIF